MKKQNNTLKHIGRSIIFVVIFILMGNVAFAAGAAGKLKDFQDVLLGWAKYLGATVAFWGAIQIGLAYKDDNPNAKEKGLRILIAGFMVAGIGAFVKDSAFFTN